MPDGPRKALSGAFGNALLHFNIYGMLEDRKKLKIVDNQLLRRYFTGEGTRAAKEVILDWFLSIRAERELRIASRELWDEMIRDMDSGEYVEDRLHEIHYKLRLEEAKAYQENRTKICLIKYITRIAAILMIPLTIFTLYNWRENIAGGNVAAISEIYSPMGARTSFTLPDGTSGWLNGGSHIQFPAEFTGKSRNVELSGEAYFKVKENPKMPFTVFSEGIKVKARGTSFNLMAYPDDINIEITLESGIVDIIIKDKYSRDQKIDELSPGNRGILLKGTNLYMSGEVAVENYISWKDGELVFRNESLTEVVKRINRWYNVNVIIKDRRLDTLTYRATFVDETLDEVLKLLQMSSPITCKDIGRKVHPDGTYGKRTIELYYSPD